MSTGRAWEISDRFDPAVLPVADRHYNRQKPGTPQFVPPGRCLVLKARDEMGVAAFWVTSYPFPEYVKHRWPGAWVCSAFRNENQADAAQQNAPLSKVALQNDGSGDHQDGEEEMHEEAGVSADAKLQTT